MSGTFHGVLRLHVHGRGGELRERPVQGDHIAVAPRGAHGHILSGPGLLVIAEAGGGEEDARLGYVMKGFRNGGEPLKSTRETSKT